MGTVMGARSPRRASPAGCLRRPHGERPHLAVLQDELRLQDQGSPGGADLQGLVDAGTLVVKLHVDQRALDPDTVPSVMAASAVATHFFFPLLARSRISLVILSCRVLLYRSVKRVGYLQRVGLRVLHGHHPRGMLRGERLHHRVEQAYLQEVRQEGAQQRGAARLERHREGAACGAAVQGQHPLECRHLREVGDEPAVQDVQGRRLARTGSAR